ncbi:MAG: hypothetical protein ACYTEI_00915 [Planctomycetota bacterium]|jgi:hypothetical protein
MTKLNETTKVRPLDLLVAAAMIATGTQAYGEVIIFTNPPEGEPGHFDWPGWLDITRPSTEQDGLAGPSSVGHVYDVSYDGDWEVLHNLTSGGASVAASTGFQFLTFTLPIGAGQQIGGDGLDFSSESNHAAAWIIYDPYYYFVESFFSGMASSYMAVRFSDVDGYHYGWIKAARHYGWIDFDVFAWAYETEPDVPIIAGIPAPGTLAALAFGAVVTRRGRKRKDV